MIRKAVNMLASVIIAATGTAAQMPNTEPSESRYFAIEVVDRQTGRGVPLVELKTTNQLRYITDSHGIVAFLEPGLMDREVFFHIASHGYAYPKDGFGYRGVRLTTTPGTTARIEIDRINIAERLYRVTGQGIYRDSVLVGRPVPLKNPVLNGRVMGQDSVYTCIYHDRLFWLWGDTGRPSYPLGHFGTAGALSDLPGHGGLDPAQGVDLEYYVSENGFSRPVADMKKPGMVWLDGLLAIRAPDGRERMIARFARMKDLGEAYEQGLMVFKDATASFEPIVLSKGSPLPYTDPGHALPVTLGQQKYYYFATQFPLAVRMRVKADWETAIDPNRYEAFTALDPSGDGASDSCRWVPLANLTGGDSGGRTSVIDALKKEKADTHLYDVETGKKISPHGGSVYFNAYRQRWIMIVVQVHGENSYLGEVWYAEADTPVGPWTYARRIATHNKYSFYNPMHHPYFDQDGGRTIYFEGTYSYTFSGPEETATPRYDYNQIMYRLNLNDPRLVLPVPVYRVKDEEERHALRLGENLDGGDRVPEVAFFAVEPNRDGKGFIPIYAENGRLTTKPSTASSNPLFCALPLSETPSENAYLVNLYEYRHSDSGEYRYETESGLSQRGWGRAEKPLCRVWKTPPGPLLFDPETGLVTNR